MPKYTQPRRAWKYARDLKVKAVKLSYQDGIQSKQVAEALDIHPFMLSRWRKKYREGRFHTDSQKRVYVNKNTNTVNKRELTENLSLIHI